MLVDLLLESIVEQGAVDLLWTYLSAHERHQGVQAVALRILVVLTEDSSVCACERVCVCTVSASCSVLYLCACPVY